MIFGDMSMYYNDLSDPSWLKAELKRYSYKPSCRMEIVECLDSHIKHQSHWALRLTISVPDSRWIPGTVRFNYGLDPYDTVAYMPSTDERNRPMISIGGAWPIPDWISTKQDGQALQKFIREVLYDFEVHESREWFRQDGVLVDDPHAPQPARKKVD